MRLHPRRLLFLLLAVFLPACDAIQQLPQTPTPSPSTQSPVSIPVVLPSPTPAPAPTPTPVLGAPSTPAPSPEPSATPTPPEGGIDGAVKVLCSPAIPPDGFPCPKSVDPQFVKVVESAILELTRERPELFDGYTVKNELAYYNGVFQNLFDAGYCAIMDGPEEIAVSHKSDPYYRENYDIFSSRSLYRVGPATHESACSLPH